MTPARVAAVAGTLLLAVGAPALSQQPAPKTPREATSMPEEIRLAAAELRRAIPLQTSIGDAVLRAERLGFSCYIGAHEIIDGLFGGYRYCTRSCSASVENGWWVRVLAGFSHEDLDVSAVHGDGFAPRDSRRCAVRESVYVEITYEDRELRYKGEVVGGIPGGTGEGTWRDGTRYEGEWAEGQPEGWGTMTLPSGEMRKGDWKRGQLNGEGEQRLPDGGVYEGNFVGGKPNGKGKQRLKDGTTYRGDFVDGIKSGRGEASYTNGDRYDGDWQSDLWHGPGLLRRRDGLRYLGEWVNGKFTGEGLVIFENSRVFKGQFLDGKPQGKGTCTSPQKSAPEPCELKLPP